MSEQELQALSKNNESIADANPTFENKNKVVNLVDYRKERFVDPEIEDSGAIYDKCFQSSVISEKIETSEETVIYKVFRVKHIGNAIKIARKRKLDSEIVISDIDEAKLAA